jgi:hypothetical protein
MAGGWWVNYNSKYRCHSNNNKLYALYRANCGGDGMNVKCNLTQLKNATYFKKGSKVYNYKHNCTIVPPRKLSERNADNKWHRLDDIAPGDIE